MLTAVAVTARDPNRAPVPGSAGYRPRPAGLPWNWAWCPDGDLMWYRIAADLVVAVHLLFICFVVGGVFLAWRWPKIIWVQLPAMVYGALIEFIGFTSPLTPL